MQSSPSIANRACKCVQCRMDIIPGAQIAWRRVMVQSHRDGAGRIWEKPAYKARHWDCRPFVLARDRAAQLADIAEKAAIVADIGPAAVEYFEDMRIAILSAG